METQTNSSPSRLNVGYFFLSLGVLVSLISSVVSFLNLVFATLNKRLPDVLNAGYEYGYSTYQYEGMRTALSVLIIFFPIYLVISYFWKKFEQMELGSIDRVIRKWVIYIILFLSSVVVTVDLVALVRYFISGEITTRFIFKVLTVLVTAGVVGAYYIYRLRHAENPSHKVGLVFGAVAILLVAFAICYSFMIMGSPREQRQLRLDDRRVSDLQNLQYQVINYWQQKQKLPASLEELNNPLTGSVVPVPPEFEKGEMYEYKALDAKKFELCATFAQPMPQGWKEYNYGYGGGIRPFPMMAEDSVSSPGYPGGVNESWDHEAGRTCYERTIDPDLFPPYPKPL